MILLHPPIPPKSKFFSINHSDGIARFHKGYGIFHAVNCADEYERGVYSSVAEVEWRKRAERCWKYSRDQHERRTPKWKNILKFDAAAESFIDIAFEWRAWGEQK